MKKNKLAIFASGAGTNAVNILKHFHDHPAIEVSLIFTNNKDAGVILRARNYCLPCIVFNRKDFYETAKVQSDLKDFSIDYIILAGFLWLIPGDLIKNYPGRIINIHPALLPRYGGKGMYGNRVHETVIASGDKESGITIHFVNEEYDAGNIIFQAKCEIISGDTPETLATKVHKLEYRHYPEVIEQLINEKSHDL